MTVAHASRADLHFWGGLRSQPDNAKVRGPCILLWLAGDLRRLGRDPPMTAIHPHPLTHGLPTGAGYIIDGGIAWWKVQARGQAIVVTVTGEIDASNAGRFANTIRYLTTAGRPLALDLSALDFLGVQGFRGLFRLNEACHRINLRWAIVDGPAVRILTRIADRDHALPMVDTVAEALQQLAADTGGVVATCTPKTAIC
jgi:anti-anti-sigma factor